MVKGKEYCIICGERKAGLPVEDDYVISSIRWFKANVTKNEKNNSLVVCRDCYSEYKKQRKRYEGRQRNYIALGIVFIMVGLLVSQTVYALLVGLGVFALLYFFSLLSYTPKIEIRENAENR